MSAKRSKVKENRLHAFFTTLTEDLHESPLLQSPAVQRQLSRMRKKAEISRPGLKQIAINDFVVVNSVVGEINVSLTDCQLFADMRMFLRHVLEKYTKRIDPSSLQECLPLGYILENWSFGPGTSHGIKGSGTVEKFDQPMVCTRSALPLVKDLRRFNPYFAAVDAAYGVMGYPVVDGSSLSTVLKNEDSERTIAVEPPGNMALQLSAGQFLGEVLAMLGINLTTQPTKNRRLACSYSKSKKGGTIDLKRASDMFSKSFVRLTWPSEWYDLFVMLRSPRAKLEDGRIVELEMMSTMGNGFTFPMMTLTLVALIYAVRRARGGPWNFIDLQRTAVFGDDIIVPDTDFDDVCAALSRCGLVVNHDKSYNTGTFRESCGGDYDDGEFITPFYVKSLADKPSIYIAINGLLQWSAQHEVLVLRSLRYLWSILDKKVYFVPEWMQPFSGVQVQAVERKYKFLAVKPMHLPYTGGSIAPLAAGGYIVSSKNGALYMPRLNRGVRYESRKAKLPGGYLDGWDPGYRTSKQSSWVQLMVELVK